MTANVFTIEEKLEEVRRLLAINPRNEVLKAICQDLHARLDHIPSVTLVDLDRVVTAAVRSKTPVGYPHSRLVDLGTHVLGRWSVIRQSLEQFGAKVEETA